MYHRFRMVYACAYSGVRLAGCCRCAASLPARCPRRTRISLTCVLPRTALQVETGNPFMLYKDSANRKSNQQNLGTIKSSNLCTGAWVWGGWLTGGACRQTCTAWHLLAIKDPTHINHFNLPPSACLPACRDHRVLLPRGDCCVQPGLHRAAPLRQGEGAQRPRQQEALRQPGRRGQVRCALGGGSGVLCRCWQARRAVAGWLLLVSHPPGASLTALAPLPYLPPPLSCFPPVPPPAAGTLTLRSWPR